MIARGLLPVYHADRLAEGTLVLRWLCVLSVVLAGAAAAGVAMVAGVPGEERRVLEGIEENRRLIAESDKSAGTWRSQAAAASKTIEARKAVGEHPDWGLLIERLAGAAGPSVAIEEIAISNGTVTVAAPPASSVPGAPVPKQPVRRKWVVAVSGLAPKQSTVGQVVSVIEQWGLFNRVKLIESKARSIGKVDAVGFKIEGVIEEGSR
ncbi:MAG: hypothetical protein HEQ23_09195 [Tepidisphaera sp.]